MRDEGSDADAPEDGGHDVESAGNSADDSDPTEGNGPTGSNGSADDSDSAASFDERVDRARAAIERDSSPGDREQIRQFTTDRRSLETRVRIQWGLWTTVGALVLSLIATAVLGALDVPLPAGLGVFVGLLGLGIVLVHLRYRRWVFQIRTDALYLERGVFTHRRTLVPYVRIQHVDTSRSPIERALGLSTLVVYTAGSRGADVSIPGLTPEEARDLQSRVKELAIEAEGGDAL